MSAAPWRAWAEQRPEQSERCQSHGAGGIACGQQAELSRGGQRERHTACTAFMMTRGGGYRRGFGPSLRFLDTEFGVSAPALSFFCFSSFLLSLCAPNFVAPYFTLLAHPHFIFFIALSFVSASYL